MRKITSLIGLFLMSLAVAAFAQAQNYGGFYLLKTKFQGTERCLEGNQVKGSMNGAAFMDTCQNVTGQLWRFEPAGNGFYKMQTQFGAPKGECLEGNQFKGDVSGVAFMDKCQAVSGQLWKIEELKNGFVRLKTQFRGDGECLEGNEVKGFAKAGGAFMNRCSNVTGQQWKMEQVRVQ